MNVIDSSGWLEYLSDGENADFFAVPLSDAENLVTPTICMYEIFKRVLSTLGEEKALNVMGTLVFGQTMELSRDLAIDAARISTELKLAMADSIILASARACGATLWTQDAHFKDLEGVQYIAKKKLKDFEVMRSNKMAYQLVKVPEGGAKISIYNGVLQVPDNPILPFIEGDGTGRDIWRAAVRVFDAAVEKAYGGKRKIHWMEVFAGEKAFLQFQTWLPDETIEAFTEFMVGIKGPLTTPIGGGIRSLNVALRKLLDLYVCQRPVRYYAGVPSPMKHPEYVDMVIFRENTEDIYTGIEFAYGTEENKKFKELLKEVFPKEYAKMRFPDTAGIGIKPVSVEGTERLVRAAIQWALDNKRKSVNFVHKGNIMKFTEGAFKDWGYALAKREFRNEVITERESWILGNKEKNTALSMEENARQIDPGFEMMSPNQQNEIKAEVEAALTLWDTHGNGKWKSKLMIKDSIADVSLQFTIIRPRDYDVIATLNLNGDYLSDALAAQVGGIGIAPGANINYLTGHAIFEATHGTAPKYADLDKVNPGSVILSGEMMFRYTGWTEAADLIVKGMEGAIAAKTVTYDFARLMDGATEVKCSEFGDAIIQNM